MRLWFTRLSWMAFGIAGLYGVSWLAGAVNAGPLDPPAPLGSTMKTLGDIPPSWHQNLSADDGPNSCNSSRFKCVLSGQLVLDNETGLVWELQPSSDLYTWQQGHDRCHESGFAGRLPELHELQSLLDSLPVNSPFVGVTAFMDFWSATSFESDGAFAWTFRRAGVGGPSAKTNMHHSWCVRAP